MMKGRPADAEMAGSAWRIKSRSGTLDCVSEVLTDNTSPFSSNEWQMWGERRERAPADSPTRCGTLQPRLLSFCTLYCGP